MLAIDDGLAAFRDGVGYAVADALEIILKRAFKRDMDLIVPGLGDIDDGVAIGGDKARNAGIVGGGTAGALGHAEGREFRLHLGPLAEEFRVERISAGIAAFDIIDAQIVEHLCDGALVVEREVDAGRLRAVPQRGVEQGQSFAGHQFGFP